MEVRRSNFGVDLSFLFCLFDVGHVIVVLEDVFNLWMMFCELFIRVERAMEQ